ncbi:MAG: hypothetical protein Q4G67_04725 [Actinomycetia bacterium]|nr:hypothetical protein [Actinomycetes bacterium]
MTALPDPDSPFTHDPFSWFADPITTEDQAAEVVHSLLSLDDVVRGALLMLLCDDDQRVTVPVLISDVGVTETPSPTIERWFEALEHSGIEMPATMIFARARPGQSFILDHDRAWQEAVLRAADAGNVDLLGSFVVTQHAVIPFPQPVPPGSG